MNNKLYWLTLSAIFLVGYLLNQFAEQPAVAESNAVTSCKPHCAEPS
jgi:hypothetical protein